MMKLKLLNFHNLLRIIFDGVLVCEFRQVFNIQFVYFTGRQILQGVYSNRNICVPLAIFVS